jgi:hypothetical protein
MRTRVGKLMQDGLLGEGVSSERLKPSAASARADARDEDARGVAGRRSSPRPLARSWPSNDSRVAVLNADSGALAWSLTCRSFSHGVEGRRLRRPRREKALPRPPTNWA